MAAAERTPVTLTCETPRGNSAYSVKYPLTLCTWENAEDSNPENHVLLSFSNSNTNPIAGYRSNALDFAEGRCPLEIENVRKMDFANWQCTLFSMDGKHYRGHVTLKKSYSQTHRIPATVGSFTASRGKPIITSYDDVSSGGVYNLQVDSVPVISEVKVESPGLIIKQKKPSSRLELI